MISLIRLRPGQQLPPDIEVIATRVTPAYADPAGGTDHFVVHAAERLEFLKASGLEFLPLGDGWYEVPPGGVAVWGGGNYWELRDTVFTVARSAPL